MEGRERGTRVRSWRLPSRHGRGGLPNVAAPSVGRGRKERGRRKERETTGGQAADKRGQVAAGERTARAVMKAEQR